jgi:hypothetical protein
MSTFREGPAGGHTTQELAAQVARIYERAHSVGVRKWELLAQR